MQRRHLIRYGFYGLGWLSLESLMGCEQRGALSFSGPSLLSGCDDRKGNHYISRFSSAGGLQYMVPVPQRVHDSTVIPRVNKAVFVARRPGNHTYVIDLESGELIQTLESQSGRHFYGHGFVSASQEYLFLAENHYQDGKGLIGVYRVDEKLEKVSEFSSYGVGPHQILLLSDQKTAVVANGGLHTHPAQGRDILNLNTMASNLAYIDINSGQLLESWRPPNQKMSIRHLSVGSDDRVVCGVQHQGDLGESVPLVGSHYRGHEINWLRCPESIRLQMRQYTASVAINSTASHALVSCPRGNFITLWDLRQQRYRHSVPCKDAAGLVACPQGHWLASGGFGDFIKLSIESEGLVKQSLGKFPVRWDNHACLV